MIGYDIQCKYPYSYDNLGKPLYNAYDNIQLKEDHEAGEIINNYWLICNEQVCENINERGVSKFKANYYVKGIDIRYFDIFATDINYDNREDLRKLGTKSIASGKYIGTVNLYKYIGTDYPENF